jgi:hypothetical protein
MQTVHAFQDVTGEIAGENATKASIPPARWRFDARKRVFARSA